MRPSLILSFLVINAATWAQVLPPVQIGPEANHPQPLEISVSLRPSIDFAVDKATDLFDFGYVGALRLNIGLLPENLLMAAVEAGGSYRNVRPLTNATFTMVGASALVGTHFGFTPRIGVGVWAGGGYHLDRYVLANEAQTNSAPQFSAEVGIDILMTPWLDLAASGQYTNYFNGLTTAAAGVSGTIYLSGTDGRQERMDAAVASRSGSDFRTPDQGTGVQPQVIDLAEVFPAFYRSYERDGLGSVTIRNQSERDAEELAVTFFVPQYMDAPARCETTGSLVAGEATNVLVSPLLTEELLRVTEGTRVTAELTIEYRMAGLMYRQVTTPTLAVLDRNSIVWDNDSRAAAFVTAKDPVVLELAKRAASVAHSYPAPAVDGNLQTAMAIHEALDLGGIGYVTDPTTPYEEYSASAQSVDFIQFPRQTLSYGAGDCDDLTVLFCALLESVGIQSAFVTVPGHIYAAFKTETDPRSLARPGDVIIRGSDVWIPVEVTLRNQGFVRAWAEGAREWREADAQGTAEFLSVADSWTQFEPVGFVIEESRFDPPSEDAIAGVFGEAFHSFVRQEIDAEIASLQERIASRPSSRLRNRVATLYATHGLFAEARSEYAAILEDEEYMPALVNLANIEFMESDFMAALRLYTRAEAVDATAIPVIAGLARTHHRLENFGFSDRYFSLLEERDPEIADQYRYVTSRADGGARASDFLALQGDQIWVDE